MVKRLRENCKIAINISISSEIDLFCLLDDYQEKFLQHFTYFVNKGFDIETQDENDDTLLTYAVKKNVLQIVKFLDLGCSCEYKRDGFQL
jgi:hypothetical protein